MTVIQGNGFVAKIVRSARRTTAAIKIQKGVVYVMVPETLPINTITALVNNKSRWIKEKLAIQQEITAIKPKAYAAGESFPCLGKNHLLKIVPGRAMVRQQHDELMVFIPEQTLEPAKAIQQLLLKWYKQQANTVLTEKTQHYAKIIGVMPTSITIKSFKSRWGSCSSSGGIYYNWKIIIAPEQIVDYVVIHELCHILHHNHSPAFWQAVAIYCPGYRDCGAWLKQHGARLEI
ncbi:MAG: SprT family zinc-dependent metalloprotease [Methylococcales bacterium]|nr:SprT family zinc-dependent metalloprotease [Methylococcales bacterium]